MPAVPLLLMFLLPCLLFTLLRMLLAPKTQAACCRLQG